MYQHRRILVTVLVVLASLIVVGCRSPLDPTSYGVTYNANGSSGGEAPVDTTTYTPGQTVTVLGNTGNLVKTGWSFAGWNTQADGMGTTYTEARTFAMGGASAILHAKWDAISVFVITVTESPGGTIALSPDTTSYTDGETVTATATAESGYAFTEWAGGLSGSTSPTSLSVTADVTVSATFTADEGHVPESPTGLSVGSPTVSSIAIAWDASPGATSYRLHRDDSFIGPFATEVYTGDSTNYTDGELLSGTAYFYKVRATNAAGDSAFTSIASGTTSVPATEAPAAPSGLIATVLSSTSIRLIWTNGSADQTLFKLERSLGEASGSALVLTIEASAATFDDTGLSANTTYYYRLCATSAGGDSGYTIVAHATTSALPAPTQLVVTALSVSRVRLSWTDNSWDETGFKVERSLSETSGFAQITEVPAASTVYDDSGLTSSTAHYYRLRATKAGGDSVYSMTETATTDALLPLTFIAIAAAGDSFIMGDDSSGPIPPTGVQQSITAGSGNSGLDNSGNSGLLDKGGQE